MLHLKCNSETVIIVLHEIYGINSHIRGVCEMLAEEKNDVICPNLLAEDRSFSQREEAAAYQNFVQNIGFSFAQQQVEKLSLAICQDYKYCFIIGYSIGATVAWLCSQRHGLYDGMVGFYGSRIRDYKDLVPRCPVLLFFPKEEPGFDVGGLTRQLLVKENVSLVQVDALHGFANPWSRNYCAQVNEAAIRQTIAFIDSQKTNQTRP